MFVYVCVWGGTLVCAFEKEADVEHDIFETLEEAEKHIQR